MYKLVIKKGFATIYKDGKEIPPLSGLFMETSLGVLQLAELVR